MSTLLTPDIRRMIGELGRRVGILERRVTGGGTATGTPPNNDIIFSYAGTLAAAESPPAKLRYGGFLATLSVALGTAGSSSTTLEVKRNGTTVATVVVPSSSADYGATVGARVSPEDRITVEITSAGTGAADMTAAARFT
jgi:hypothetical protein